MTEFFGYAVNSILYQRGLYPPSTFEVKKKYGLGMLVSSDEEIKKYLVSVLDQINEWLREKVGEVSFGDQFGENERDGGEMGV